MPLTTQIPIANDISAFIENEREHFIALSDEIWALAEIGYQEEKSASLQASMLARHGFRLSTGLAGMPTAFMAEAGEGGPIIALLGEFDALPGLNQEAGSSTRSGDAAKNGHGCGHHLLGTGALLAAVAASHWLKQHGIAGRIRYYGCPAEENGIGKAFLARAGYFDGVSAALTWHPGASTGVMTGPILANIQAYFRFTGRAAHAAAAPHLGRSALDAVELMNVGVNYLREHMPPESRVHYAITDTGGRAPNVVQANAEVLYLVRSPSAEALKALYRRVCQVAHGAAMMTETPVDIRIDKATAPKLHNPVLDQRLSELIQTLGAPDFTPEESAMAHAFQTSFSAEEFETCQRRFCLPPHFSEALSSSVMPYCPTHASVGGSTDVADVSWTVPTTQFWGACYAIGTPGHSWQNTAQGKMPYAHKGMLHAAKLLAVAVIDLIQSAETIELAKRDHEASLARYGLPDLLPDDVVPPSQTESSPIAS